MPRPARRIVRTCLLGAVLIAALVYGVSQLPGVDLRQALILLSVSVLSIMILAVLGFVAGMLINWWRNLKR